MNEDRHARSIAIPPSMTTSIAIHRILRDEIVSTERRPGEPIAEKEEARAHNVGRTPIREALLRLADEGLVEIAPRSGTRVSRIPVAILADAMFARAAIEREVARMAASNIRPSAQTMLRGILERQMESLALQDRQAFHAADEEFHRALAAAAGRTGVWTLVLQLKMQLDRYRRLTLPEPGRMARVIAEHWAILEAVSDHDRERAALEMHRHLDGLRTSLSRIRDHNPDYFIGDVSDIAPAFELLSG
jgi:DNA-binding GntR family transcriptional regulator